MLVVPLASGLSGVTNFWFMSLFRTLTERQRAVIIDSMLS